MGGTGECILSIECVASSIPIVKYVLGLSGYVVVWADLGGDLVLAWRVSTGHRDARGHSWQAEP